MRFEVFNCHTGITWTTLPERPARWAAVVLSWLTGEKFATSLPEPRLGWLMHHSRARCVLCACPVGNEYVLDHGMTYNDCDAEIADSGDVRCAPS